MKTIARGLTHRATSAAIWASFWEEAERTGRTDQIKVVHSIRHLEELIHELRALPTFTLSPPPAEPSCIRGLVEPLKTDEELRDEGLTMRHCVGSYQPKLLSGACLLYRVLPDKRLVTGRATLELAPRPDGRWHVKELAGFSNSTVSSKTSRLVETWLELAQAEPALPAEQLEAACRQKLMALPASRKAA